MDKNIITDFQRISITGRYIYAYLCIKRAIAHEKIPALPIVLDDLLRLYVFSNQLDDWQAEAQEMMPGFILDEQIGLADYKMISVDIISELKLYYTRSVLINEIIENTYWVGISNLYGKFKSEISMPYLINILSLMTDNNIALPSFEKVKDCPIEESGSWGALTEMENYDEN